MGRMLLCRRYGEVLEGLDAPPFPGQAGQLIYEQVSRRAWSEWLALQTMLINEKRLKVTDPAARAYLAEQREKFLAGKATDHIDGYVEPDSN